MGVNNGSGISGTAGVTSSSTGGGSNTALRRCIAYVGSDLNSQNYTTMSSIPFNSELEDSDGFHDNVTNNTRLTVPAGITKITLQANIFSNNVTFGPDAYAEIRKNGSILADPGAVLGMTDISSGARRLTLRSAPLDVEEGDYFEVFYQQFVDTSITIKANMTWFMIEEVI